MKIELIKKMTLAAVLLSAATCSFAKPAAIPCPQISTIQATASKIDAAAKYNGAYVAYTKTDRFIESKLFWAVAVKLDSAASDEEAIQQGKEAVSKVSIRKQETAKVVQGGVFACVYGPDNVVAIGMQNNQQGFKF